jgi:hypothetical protein
MEASARAHGWQVAALISWYLAMPRAEGRYCFPQQLRVVRPFTLQAVHACAHKQLFPLLSRPVLGKLLSAPRSRAV